MKRIELIGESNRLLEINDSVLGRIIAIKRGTDELVLYSPVTKEGARLARLRKLHRASAERFQDCQVMLRKA